MEKHLHNVYVKKDGMIIQMKIANNVIRIAKNAILLGKYIFLIILIS